MTEKNSKSLSTTALSKELNIPVKELFLILQSNGFIIRENDSWVLTELGKGKGGTIKHHHQHGSFMLGTNV
jgi:phage antirepressor YoqD-like protein